MAELFLSRTVGPEGFEKLVVLKKILPTHSENPKFVRLFLDEAKLAATLDHPNIAHVYDMGKVDGHYFFTMEYVHGQDVRTTMRRTARLDILFPIDHAVQIARNVAAALHYAHERRRPDGSLLDIVHRDVSPSNMIVSYDGAVKLVDFGVAKATTSTVKTRTGTLKGKIAYMSPEQAKGAPLDRRSDIFSLGIVLWEMVTSQRLFKAENDLATIQQIINSKPTAPSTHRPDCTAELERIILKALAIDLDERYQTAEQLQLDLEELAREQKLKQSPVSLRGYMHELFADEIQAWSAAQASGQTLTEHMVDKATEMTTPVSESELYALEDFVDDDDDSENPSGTAAPTMTNATQQISVPPPPRTSSRDLLPRSAAAAGTVDDQQPTTQLAAPAGPLIEISSGALRANPTNPTPFPIAPPEWRPAQGESTIGVSALAEDRRRRLIVGGSVAFGLIVFIAIAFGGRNPKPVAAQQSTAAEPAEMPPGATVEMTPTPVEPASPAPAPVVEQSGPPPQIAPPPASEPDAKARKKKTSPTKAPAPALTKSLEKSKAPEKVTPPSKPPERVKAPEKTPPKPAEKAPPAKPAEKTPPPPPKAPEKKFDVNGLEPPKS